MRKSSAVAVLACTAAGAAAGAYGAHVASAWMRYGRPGRAPGVTALDRFMPEYDVVERHRTIVDAPAAVAFAIARVQDLGGLPLVHAIFAARGWILGSRPDTGAHPRGLIQEMTSRGWGILAEQPDREIVLGAATRPWEADVTFRPIPPDAFEAFSEPGYVKIAWTLRADPRDANTSEFRTETRAVATDAAARRKFRVYWAFFSPGIDLIRRASLSGIRREAARRSADAGTTATAPSGGPASPA